MHLLHVLSGCWFVLSFVSSEKLETHSFDGPYKHVDEFGRRSVGEHWFSGQSTEVMKHFVRLTPDRQSKVGYLWNPLTINGTEISAVVAFRISGQGKRWFGDGIGIWITQHPSHQVGYNHGFTETYVGLGIILDTFVNADHPGGHKDVTLMVNDGTKSLETMNTEAKLGCDAAMRYHEGHGAFDPVYSSSRLKIQINQRHVVLSVDEKASGDWRACFEGDVDLPSDWLRSATMGVTAATGSLADNHDVLRLSTYDLADDPAVSSSDSDAMIHQLSKQYKTWLDTESCGVDCKLSIFQKSFDDFQVDFEHKITDLKEKTQNTIALLKEKERANEGKIEGLEKIVQDMVEKNVGSKMTHIGRSVNRKIERQVQQGMIASSGHWKIPFFLLVTGICGGSFFLYRKYQQLKKTHLL